MRRIIIYSLVSYVLFVSSCFASDGKERELIHELRQLHLSELLDIVVLDDVFDIFDALVEVQKVSVATGQEQDIAHVPAVTSIITAQDIEAMGATHLDQVLETIPGLHVGHSTLSYNSQYFIRGIYSAQNVQTLLLINGIPLKSLFAGERQRVWSQVSLNQIARIEVMRGPGSALYGADAFAGVINIITKTALDINGTQVGTRVGSFDTYEAWAQHGKRYGDVDVGMMLNYYKTQGHNEILQADGQTHYDKVHGTQASLAPSDIPLQREMIEARVDLGYEPNYANHLRLRLGYQGQFDIGTGTGVNQTLDKLGYYDSETLSIDLTHTLTPESLNNWEFTNRISFRDTYYQANEQRVAPPGFKGVYAKGRVGIPYLAQTNTYLDFVAAYSGLTSHHIRTGLGYFYGDVDEISQFMNFGPDRNGKPIPVNTPHYVDLSDSPYTFISETARSSWYAFIQDTWNITDHLSLTSGLRYDRYDDVGSTFNPRLALVWQASDNLTAKLLYGEAFRAPTFSEIHIYSPLLIGNPNLKPERIRTWELALNYYLKHNVYLGANVYTYRISDGIQTYYDPEAQAKQEPTILNTGSYKGHGFELETRWKLNARMSLMANYSYQQSIDETANSDVGMLPTQTAYLRFDWLLGHHWYLNSQVHWIAGRKRAARDPRPETPDYTTLDLAFRYKKLEDSHWNVAFGVKNIFDETVKEPSVGINPSGFISIPNDFPMAGRQYFLELRYQF
ncbi:TonB-dependent receptor [Candidatus Albibeggiatoa sp. nov. NOAA]|uniref:TonB-dependent receptor plug domain-containing protein n=1 Tax=Candidatus Albibeggiatoa sp. nov. NOAA TaxID=3162724 RepID=UPI003300113D|nr:TonB-dependent receptor [Thiotrichaceae bacterium]